MQITTAKAKEKLKNKTRDKNKLINYWSIVEPKDYAKEMVAKKNERT